MLENLPHETTELLIDICTSNSLLTIDDSTEVVEDAGLPSAGRQQGFGPSYLSYLALNRGSATIETATTGTGTATVTARGRKEGTAVEDTVESTPPPTASTLPGTGGTAATTQAPKPRELVKRPSPKVYFAHFVDHMDQFVIFLETVAMRRWGQSVDDSPSATVSGEKGDLDTPVDEAAERADQISVWNTLLELYLSIPTSPEEEEKGMKAKALKILQSDKIPYDVNHSLIVCSTCQFTPGLVLLWEKLGMHEDVLRFWMDKERASDSAGDELGANEASEQLVNYLDLHGPKHRHLYPLVLRFLTSSEVLLNRHSKDVERVIDYVDEEKIMPSLAILQLLSRNGISSVGLVKGWLIRKIVEARESIDMVRHLLMQSRSSSLSPSQDSQLTTSYRLETKAKLAQVEEFSDTDEPKVFHATQCSACGSQLDLPSVHFMCNHSYHQR
jgi:vacuolar protein sorting-associated protein 11